MPPPRDLARIAGIRRTLDAADAEATAAARELAAIRLRRAEAERSGAARPVLREIGAAERAAETRRRTALRELAVHGRRLPGLVEALAEPDQALARLDAAVPVALLPIRIETRFDTPRRLLVRIYPDQIHLREHDRAVTLAEVEAAKRYWTRAWAGEGQAEDAWRDIAADLGPERAAYLVDILRPANRDAAPGGEPRFPEVETVALRGPVSAEARLLPTRWLVTLIGRDGKRMGRKWTAAVPERLALSPFGDPLADQEDVPEGELPIDEAARWLIEFARAREVGMALVIEESELEAGRFADGIARLIVVGADWTRTPENASEALLEHLCAHGYSEGLEMLVPGTATNNTVWRPSDYRGDDRARRAGFPAVPPDSAPPRSSADRLAGALGLPDGARLARFPGARATYEATVASVHGALWGAAFGFYMSEVMRPIFSDAVASDVRRHLRDHVRPAGPLPAIRVGRQPYGVLPVLSTPVRFESQAALGSIRSSFERDLALTLARMRLWVERPVLGGVSRRTLDQVPTMAAVPPGVNPEDHLAAILKMGPIATRAEIRATAGRSRKETTRPLEEAQRTHAEIVRLVLANLGVPMGGVLLRDESGEFVHPTIFELVSPERPRYALSAVPWVAADPASADAVRQAVEKVRARIAEAIADPSRIRQLLAVGAEDAATLFEGLLLLSAAFEYWRAGERMVRDPRRETVFAGTLVSELVGVAEPEPPRPGLRTIETPRQLLQLEARSVTSSSSRQSLVAHIHDRIFASDVIAPLRDARDFHDALDALAERPAREVDHALRGLVDLGSHRLDAWITSMATRRLRAQRAARPRGVHLGGYGLVHDLAPDITPDSEGYVHVPSADHAVTGAVLRAGHMANRDDKPDAFAIRLTSERVRNALYLTEGMAQGQRVSALLGYRFERWLVEGRMQAKYINAFRRLAPHPNDPAPQAGPQEAIAARDVVDGQKLAEMWRDRRDAVLADLAPLAEPPVASLPPDDRAALAVELDRLVDLFDAFLDLWTSESVHQLARGNPDRAAAALAVVDRQERPTEPMSVQTPRGAWGYVQRVMWVLPAAETAEGWPEDVVSRVEPGANALAARLIGDPGRFGLTARTVGADGTPLDRPRLRPLALTDLGLSPLSLVLLAERTGRDRGTRLEERIAAAFAGQRELPEGAGIALDGVPDADAPGLDALLALLESVRGVLFDRRPLTQREFAPVSGIVPDLAAVDRVLKRADALEEELVACEAALTRALPDDGRPARAALRKALARAAGVVPVPSWTLTAAAAAAPLDELAEAGEAVRASLTQLVARWRSIVPVGPKDEQGDADAVAGAEMEAAVQRIRAVFGPAFPVLPPFSVSAPLAAHWKAGLDDQAALRGGQSPLVLVQWLRSLSLVRPSLRALAAALDAAAWTGHAEAGGSPRIAQLPHVTGRRWVGLPFDGEPPEDVRVSGVMLGELAAGGKPMVGVLLDEWTEAIPERSTTTSVTFQYDAPGARPPQTICLAVDAGVSGGGWTADALVSTVNELFDLARLRLLTPQQIAGHGAVLPTMFIPRNLSSELPSFDLVGRFELATAHLAADALLLGKS